MPILNSLRDKWFLRKHLSQQFTSEPLRRLFSERYKIDVGMYSYGCFDESRIARGVTIGRYCSFANTAHIFSGNHGIDFLSLHPYLYNVQLGCVESETIKRTRCVVEDDVWVGHAAIVLPQVELVGRGSVIGAGAVVTRNVPRYAIVAGNPARIVRFRFSEAVIDRIEATEWWKLPLSGLKALIKDHPDMVFCPERYFSIECGEVE
jgi:acetyltransferase-like isoleucine patch superfamily enzyme